MKTLIEYNSSIAAEQLACDETLFRLAESGRCGECARIYELDAPAVVMGVSGKFRDEAFADRCERDKVPLLRRVSGGGTVLLGAGSTAWSLVMDMRRRPELRSLKSSYSAPLKSLADSLAGRGVPAAQAGISDLAVDGWKIGGSAQKRGRNFILLHGTLLCGMDLSLIGRYLRAPAEQPAYRAGRAHEDFVRNLPIEKERAVEAIREAFGLNDAAPAPKSLARAMEEMIAPLTREKYANPAWNLRR